jgi:hypothetical protein
VKLPKRLLPVTVKSSALEARFATERAQRFADLESLIIAREARRGSALQNVSGDDLQRRATASHRAARRAEQLEAMARRAETQRAALPRGEAPTPRRALGWRPSLAAQRPRTVRSVDPGTA